MKVLSFQKKSFGCGKRNQVVVYQMISSNDEILILMDFAIR